MKLHIKNGRLIDPASGTDAQQDLFIADGKVVATGKAPDGFAATRTVDASGMVVMPGLVDLSARLREPGYEYKATLESEMQAAMQGGVTSLVCPPDTDPVLDEPGLVEMLKHRAKTLNQANVYPLGALTAGLKGEALTEMAELTEAGCIGFSQAEVPVANTTVLMRALQYANTFGYTVWLRPQDPHLGRGGIAHSGPVASRLGLPGVPVAAETIALHTIFELMRVTGARVHLCRMSSAAGLALVRAAKKEGLPVSCDVGVHHVHLTDVDIGFFDPNARMTPPLRAQRDRDAIREALLDGTVDAICSDHTPVDDDEKLLPFGEASPGATGLELLLPLVLKWADEGAERSPQGLATALAKVTSDAARVAGLAGGRLAPGSAADICVFDPAARWRVDANALASQGKHTPFRGYEMSGQVKMTIVAGHIAFER
ncbi:MAG TPA: dihydroorotase [Noviherbaspirillum sp.]|uniref:dihydroorotase n=1 Tax=Noviherbaspirillum sp. TaxID=1926288 RepID=UPI002D5FC922|nr:dihydroorotase [Noviherbaspirillum sp.]HYD95605.1 dihydroorotase [Noviherbaspirillum sp.]